jgi:hypothetical protein
VKARKAGAVLAILIAALLGGLLGGVAGAAYYQSPDDWFYAQTGLDGIIHCGLGIGSLTYLNTGGEGNPPLDPWYIATPGSVSNARRDYYCGHLEVVPPGYVSANANLYRNAALCVSTGWFANSGSSTGIGVYIRKDVRACGGNGWFAVISQQDNAINLQYRQGNQWSPDFYIAG